MADAISIQELIDARTDAKTLEEAVNGDAVTTVLTRLGETYPTLSNALNQIDGQISDANDMLVESVTTLFTNGGLPATPFATKALMIASALVDGDFAQVTDDTVNNGLYVKTAGAWVKSGYDPVATANTYTDESIENIASIDDTDKGNLFVLKDANLNTVAKIDVDGKTSIIGLPTDLVSHLDNLDPSDKIYLSSKSGNIIDIVDDNGNKTLYQDSNGDIYAPRVGNLTQAVVEAHSASKKDGLLGVHKAGKYVDALRSESMPSVNNTGHLITGNEVGLSGKFSHHVNQLREPGLLRVGKYRYLVFFDAKGEQGDFGLMSQGVVTVDIDPETLTPTTSNITNLHEAFTDTDGKLKVVFGGCGVKTNSGKVICMYISRYMTEEHKLYMRTSDDDGVTWNPSIDLTDMVRGQTTGWNLLCPTSKGIVKRYGKHKGRIVMPLWTMGHAYNHSSSTAGYIYSDDDGVTWKLGEFVNYYQANELCIAEYLNGDMMFIIRLVPDRGYMHKILVRHSDETKEFTQIAHGREFGECAIMSGCIQGDNEFDGTASKFMFTTCRDFYRYDLLVHTSYDGGDTWQTKLVDGTEGVPVGYTAIESIDANHVLIVWESGHANDFSYSVISLNNLVEL